MGSWNGTCAVSNLHIQSSQDVVVFMLEKRHDPQNDFCYNNSIYNLCYMPFFGKNDSYGGIENCHGAGLDMLMSEIRDNLYEMDLGANKYHDIEVKKDNFDMALLFEADHEDRLYIKTDPEYFSYENKVLPYYLEKEKTGKLREDEFEHKQHIEEKLKKGVSPCQRITHIQIHAQIFQDILDNYKVGFFNGKRTVNVSFAQALEQIPAVINKLKEDKDSGYFDVLNSISLDNNIVAKYFSYLDPFRTSRLMNPMTVLKKMISDDKLDLEITAIMTDFLKGFWFDSFMSVTRKIYVKQCGSGSQSQEHKPYEILTKSMNKIIKAEKKEQKEFEKKYG